MTEQEEMVYELSTDSADTYTVKSYPKLIEELMFQIFVQGENPCGNFLGPLMIAINFWEFKLNTYK